MGAFLQWLAGGPSSPAVDAGGGLDGLAEGLGAGFRGLGLGCPAGELRGLAESWAGRVPGLVLRYGAGGVGGARRGIAGELDGERAAVARVAEARECCGLEVPPGVRLACAWYGAARDLALAGGRDGGGAVRVVRLALARVCVEAAARLLVADDWRGAPVYLHRDEAGWCWEEQRARTECDRFPSGWGEEPGEVPDGRELVWCQGGEVRREDGAAEVSGRARDWLGVWCDVAGWLWCLEGRGGEPVDVCRVMAWARGELAARG